jgi:hypothetical protein
MKREEISANSLVAIFVYSSGILILLAAIAKLISNSGHDRILDTLDPVFDISFRSLLYLAAVVEFGVAAICLFCKNRKMQAGLIALLSTYFVLYRVGLLWLGYRLNTCPCLGFLTDALHVSVSKADIAMKIILAYLLIGSCAALFWLQWRYRKAEGKTENGEAKPSAAKSDIQSGS